MPQIVKEIQPFLPLFSGRTTDITLPSGRVVKIRETNGEDDEILSSLNASSDGSNVYNFLSSITLHDSYLDRKPTPADIENWPINDKYGLLFKQRVFIYGNELHFKAECTEENCHQEHKYFQDLSQWAEIEDYPMGKDLHVEFVISSGKKFKYSILTGKLEKAALELKDNTKNSPLVIRHLSIENKGEWLPVKHFAAFSSKEMAEIRSNIKINDKQFDPIVKFTCNNPLCRKSYEVSLFTISTFFYPEEMI